VKLEFHAFLTSALDGGEWSAFRRGHFTSRERALFTHWIWSWVGPIAWSHLVVKRKKSLECPYRQSNPGHPDRSQVNLLTELPRVL